MVKCADCGYLALRRRADWVLDEAPDGLRETGQRPGETLFSIYPLCFARQINIQKEAESLPEEIAGRSLRILQIIASDRDCDGYTEWQQGFTPKEHREMLDRQWMLEREEARDRQAKHMRWLEFGVALIAVMIILVAALIQRSGQPTINVIYPPEKSVITIDDQQLTPGKEVAPP